jgi:ankyrin repeat protein
VLDTVAFADILEADVMREVFEFLVSKGAKINSVHLAAYQGDLSRVKSFLQGGGNVNKRAREKGPTLLEYAVRGGKIEVVKLLISEGADVNVKSEALAPLFYAVSNGEDVEVAKLLLSNGADPNVSVGDVSVLHTAVGKRNIELVELLVKNGADVNAKGPLGMTALEYARRRRAGYEIISLLEEQERKE